MPTVKLRLEPLLPWQQQVVQEARRFNVLSIGRRAGKTFFAQDRCAQRDVLRLPVAWFSPSYKYMVEVWRETAARFAPIIARQNISERRMEFVTGGVLEFWTLENPRAGMGRKYRRVIIDEAAFVPNLLDIWNYSIRPTLADYAGDAFIVSTPKGRNGFWQMWQRGQDDGEPDWMSWRMASEVNPLIPASELAAMRRQLPERVAQQELDAMFLEDAGGVFRNVMAAATATEQTAAVPGHQYVVGVDWAQSNDFTVLAVFDVTEGALVCLERFNQIDYELQKGRLIGLVNRFRPMQVIAETNSMGRPIIDSLSGHNIPIMPFTTTNATKAAAIQALQLAFETGAIRIIPDAVLIGELQAYEMDRTATGLVRYGAPDGMHDDTVMATALGWQGVATGDMQVWLI